MSKVLLLDSQNLLHRSRAGLQGQFSVVFNFFRSLRKFVADFKPDRVVFVREGHPKARHSLLESYKGNRLVEEGTAKHSEMVDFHRQCNLVVDLVSLYFPISVARHPDHECDDTIYNLIKRASRSTEFVVLSNDSDFVQLLQEFPNVSVWNPMRKCWVENPDYDYVIWKALRGDGSDNIPGIPGVGDKTAAKLASDPVDFGDFMEGSPEAAEIFARNMDLITFATWNDDEAGEMTSSCPTRDWDAVRAAFTGWEFASIVNDESWAKFVASFDSLWATYDEVSGTDSDYSSPPEVEKLPCFISEHREDYIVHTTDPVE